MHRLTLRVFSVRSTLFFLGLVGGFATAVALSAQEAQTSGARAGADPEATPPSAAPFLAPAELSEIDAAIARGVGWLLERQGPTGAFTPGGETSASPVLLTALPLWALAETRPEVLADGAIGLRACGALFRHRQDDGGIYFTGGGAAEYESRAARAALRGMARHRSSPQIERFIRALEVYLEERFRLEHLEPALANGPALDALIEKSSGLDAEQQKALEFLDAMKGTSRASTGVSARERESRERLLKENRPRCVFTEVRPTEARTCAALESLRAGNGLEATRLCDHFEEFRHRSDPPRGTLAALLLAQSLAPFRSPTVTIGAVTHEWPREVSREVLAAQGAEGSWGEISAAGELHADRFRDPLFETCFALVTLARCRQVVAE